MKSQITNRKSQITIFHFPFSIFLTCLLPCTFAFAQSPALTTITGQIFTSQANPLNAKVVISNPPFISPDGYTVAAGSVTVQAPSGMLRVRLVPTAGGMPEGTLYSVVITTAAGVEEQQTWSVPVSLNPVSLNSLWPLPNNVSTLPTLAAGGGLAGSFPNPTVNVTPPLMSNATTIWIPQATASQNGYLASTDWLRFNSGPGLVFIPPLGNASGAISIPQASASQNGYLASTDWSTLNAKQAALGFTPENTANKNQANGYAGLDSSGLLSAAQIPNTSATVSVAPSTAGNFTVAHGLGRAPIEAIVTMTSGGAIWCQATCFDATNLYLVASDASLTAAVRVK